MKFPEDIWRLILTYLGPNKASIEWACRRAGIHLGKMVYDIPVQSTNLTFQVTSTTNFFDRIQTTYAWGVIIFHVKRIEDEKDGVFEVHFTLV